MSETTVVHAVSKGYLIATNQLHVAAVDALLVMQKDQPTDEERQQVIQDLYSALELHTDQHNLNSIGEHLNTGLLNRENGSAGAHR